MRRQFLPTAPRPGDGRGPDRSFVGDAAAQLIRLQRLDDAGEASLFLCAPRQASLSGVDFFLVPARGHSLASSISASVRAARSAAARSRLSFQPTWPTGRVRAGIRQVCRALTLVDDRRRRTRRARRWRGRGAVWQSTPGRCRLARPASAFRPCVPRARPLLAIPAVRPRPCEVWPSMLANLAALLRKPATFKLSCACLAAADCITAISTGPFSIRSVTAASSSRASFTRLPSCSGLLALQVAALTLP